MGCSSDIWYLTQAWPKKLIDLMPIKKVMSENRSSLVQTWGEMKIGRLTG